MHFISDEQHNSIQSAAVDRSIVRGATHRFYRYPARFSPQFARTVIEEFTSPGDLVYDPFLGGGTTAVEALRSGRRCVGSDINELALFVSKVKCTVLSKSDVQFLERWLPGFSRGLKLSKSGTNDEEWRTKGYFRHIETDETWRNRNLIQSALSMVEELPSEPLKGFVRCVVLRSAQLSLDGRRSVMTLGQLREKIVENFLEMLSDMRSLLAEVSELTEYYGPDIIKSDASSMSNAAKTSLKSPPKLILTSPPYPGVHVLYHRWQVKGRRETAAPYWIANKLDGDGERYYTLGNRHEKGLKSYFENIEAVFRSLATTADPSTMIVQMVAFSDPDWQLDRYLEAMKNAGFKESVSQLGDLSEQDSEDHRIWRDVPNRKWHAQRQSKRSSSKEVILFHSLA